MGLWLQAFSYLIWCFVCAVADDISIFDWFATLSIKTAQKPYIIGSLGPKAFKK